MATGFMNLTGLAGARQRLADSIEVRVKVNGEDAEAGGATRGQRSARLAA